jgi:hypothetical protein
MRLPLIGGSYTTRSIIASAQRCINYYPEALPRYMQQHPMIHYQRPGLVPKTVIGSGPVRLLYQTSDGSGYCVSGSQLFRINSDFSGTFLGGITTGRTNPCSMVDNGFNWVLVDGSTNGWTGTLGGTDFGPLSTPTFDPQGAFTGADRVDYVDTYIIWNEPGTVFFGSTYSNMPDNSDPAQTFDGLYVAGKTGWPDNLQTLYVNRHEILLLGSLKTEIWYDAGNPNFPFAVLPGAYVEHGIAAKYSVSHYDIETYWLGRDLQGHGVVFRFRGYMCERISNHALEYAIREMAAGLGINDAIGFTYQLDGHPFYMLTFPAGDQTWVYDPVIGDPTLAWHQEADTDVDGFLHRHRARCAAVINDVNCVGDYVDGTIYQLDLDTYTDTVAGVTKPITCVRSFPHIGGGRLMGTSQQAEWDGRRMQYSRFMADLECGLGPKGINGLPAQVSLRWSDDRGRTWGNAVLQSAGEPGHYETFPTWQGLGISRDRVFEVSHSIAGPAALQGAWVDVEVVGT